MTHEENTTDEHIEQRRMNRTARTAGAVGARALVPQFIAKHVPTKTMYREPRRLLDYGAGPKAIHAEDLTRQGYSVDAWDIGRNWFSDTHVGHPLYHTYHVVYASNVVNVQPDEAHVKQLIDDMGECLETGGNLILNHPKSPRKNDLTDQELNAILEAKFATVLKLKFKSGHIWSCWNLKGKE